MKSLNTNKGSQSPQQFKSLQKPSIPRTVSMPDYTPVIDDEDVEVKGYTENQEIETQAPIINPQKPMKSLGKPKPKKNPSKPAKVYEDVEGKLEGIDGNGNIKERSFQKSHLQQLEEEKTLEPKPFNQTDSKSESKKRECEETVEDSLKHRKKSVQKYEQEAMNIADMRKALQKNDEEIKEKKAQEKLAEEARKKEKEEKKKEKRDSDKTIEQLEKEEITHKEMNEGQRPVIQRGSKYHQFKQLTVTEFYCEHYQLIKQIAENLLTPKYGKRLIKALSDTEERLKIEQDSIADVREYLVQRDIVPENDDDMREYIKVTFAEIMGFGILEYLLDDPEVDEVIVQSHDYIQAEKHGIITDTEYKFPSYDAALGVARKIIQPLNKSLDFANPNVDGYLPNGSRLSASIPPLKADNDISMTIRKFSNDVHPLMYYAEKFHSETPEMVKFIEMCVKAKKNLIVAGGTGSGKTTLLNSMSYAIGDNERIITVEETPELRIQKARVEPYLTVDGNNEGSKGISIRDIVIYALRKRPDRIIVGECRSGEIFEFLNAANTGHEGSTTSLHANSPALAFDRMENMMLQNEETKNMTHEAILRVLASSVQIVVQVNRMDDGSRKVTQITEVLGYGRTGYDKLRRYKQIKDNIPCNENMIYLRDIFKFKELETEVHDDKKIVHGQFLATGYVPTFLHSLRMKGFDIDEKFFEKRILLEV